MVRPARHRRTVRHGVALALAALVATACQPYFWLGSTVGWTGAGGTDVRLIWDTAYDAQFPDPSHLIDTYEVWVDGALVATHSRSTVSCLLIGLAPSTSYDVEVVAESTSGERSDGLPAPFGVLATTVVTPTGPPGGVIDCVTETDTDGDRLPDAVETGTGTYVDRFATGTDPNLADTDGDGIADGDEVVGTVDGLALPLLGADPLRATIFLEIDWFDDSQECGFHSHRPSKAAVERVVSAFDKAPTTNPDGTTGIDLVVDYGQGDGFGGGSLIDDPIPPFGSIDGGVNGATFQSLKAANFNPVREGYFHYSVHMHRYNTSSNSSGQAELPGDDLIVSLQCFESLTNTSNTLMHELGHNLGLRHGGNVNIPNWKPNYNSVMNYRFQFSGVDYDIGEGAGACDAVGNQQLDFSAGTRPALDENAVVEADGVCGGPPSIDWNNNAVIDPLAYVWDLNRTSGGFGDGQFQVLEDHNDWGALNFGGVADGDGLRLGPAEVVSEPPVPLQFRTAAGD